MLPYNPDPNNPDPNIRVSRKCFTKKRRIYDVRDYKLYGRVI